MLPHLPVCISLLIFYFFVHLIQLLGIVSCNACVWSLALFLVLAFTINSNNTNSYLSCLCACLIIDLHEDPPPETPCSPGPGLRELRYTDQGKKPAEWNHFAQGVI